jgi:hypothetical protein
MGFEEPKRGRSSRVSAYPSSSGESWARITVDYPRVRMMLNHQDGDKSLRRAKEAELNKDKADQNLA